MSNEPQTATILPREYTDVLRGMAMILIMGVHAWTPFSSFPRCMNLVSSLSVAVFLFLSGYGLSESHRQKGLTGFFRRKFNRIVFPYWIWLLLTIPLRPFDLTALLGNFFFIPADDNYLYFIVYLVYCYAAFGMAHRFFPRHVTAVLALFTVASLFFPPLSATKSLSFLAGCLVSMHSGHIKRLQGNGKMARCVAVATLLALLLYALKLLPFIQNHKGTPPFCLLVSSTLLCFTPIFLAIPKLVSPLLRSRIIKMAGIMSLELYMVHSAFIPYIHTLTNVLMFYTASVILAIGFHRFNSAWMKARD